MCDRIRLSEFFFVWKTKMLQLYERKRNNCNKKRKAKNEKKYVIENKEKISLKTRCFLGKMQKAGNINKVGTGIALKINRIIC